MTQPSLLPPPAEPSTPEPARAFDGPAYEPAHDFARLTGQIQRVYDHMKDGHWRTLRELAAATGDPEASVSAQLRHLRKPKFGGYQVDRQSRGDRASGLWEYRLHVPLASAGE